MPNEFLLSGRGDGKRGRRYLPHARSGRLVTPMGFYSSLMYYRPSEPFLTTGETLVQFVRAFHALGVADCSRAGSLSVWYGVPAYALEDEPDPLDEEVEWSIEEYEVPFLDIPDRLSALDQPVRRANVALGSVVTPSDLDPLRRVGSPENDEDFLPDSWTVRLGPIATGRDGNYLVGSVAVNLSGNGYPYPWTPRDLVRRAETIESVQRVMSLCEETWPGEPIAPSTQAQAARRALGKYWPYENVDRPLDWTWGFAGVA